MNHSSGAFSEHYSTVKTICFSQAPLSRVDLVEILGGSIIEEIQWRHFCLLFCRGDGGVEHTIPNCSGDKLHEFSVLFPLSGKL